jgi:hypothetical protein
MMLRFERETLVSGQWLVTVEEETKTRPNKIILTSSATSFALAAASFKLATIAPSIVSLSP